MRIGINARYLQNVCYGIGNYLLNSVLNLKKIDHENEYLLFFGSNKPVPKIIQDAGFDCKISMLPANNQLLKILWTHAYLPSAIKRERIDLFHEPSFIAPVFKKCPTVITVYDVAFLHLPFCYTYRTRLYLQGLLSRSLRQSDRVIAISESTKRDIIDNFKISPDKVQVIYAGVEGIFQPSDNRDEQMRVMRSYKIKKDFILAVSGITPRKNFTRLVKAFRLLKLRNRIDHQLVIVGMKAWMSDEVFRDVSRSDLDEDVVFCGHIPVEDLVSLYNAASLFVYPSLYEGFGLPLLEAMACGCPVVASNTSSIPEVCGSAALLIDPRNIEELSDAIYILIRNESLRKDLIAKGQERASKFSWRKTAEDILSVYNKFNKYEIFN